MRTMDDPVKHNLETVDYRIAVFKEEDGLIHVHWDKKGIREGHSMTFKGLEGIREIHNITEIILLNYEQPRIQIE